LDKDENIKIKVFGYDDESLKTLGQLLSNETSRKIIMLLINEEMYLNEISKKLGIQMNITKFHLKKLVDVKLVTITNKKITKKGIDHDHYKMISNIFLKLDNTKEDMENSVFLRRIFKDSIKFALVGIAGILPFIIKFKNEIVPNEHQLSSISKSINLDPIIISLIIVIIGLFIIYLLEKRKKG